MEIIESVGANAEVGECVPGCNMSEDIATCVSDCLAEATGLSEECSACFGAVTGCAMENCMAECGSDPTGEECLACIDENCGADFETGSGLPME